jgi:tetratricopeptide (TPR) repeat protein
MSTEPSVTAPFVGLRPFDISDARWFFGRDQETAALTLKLRTNRFTAVVGPSGSGKSSVVRAGVVPLLKSDGWQQIIIAPGSAPLSRLAGALADVEAGDRLKEARRFRFDVILRGSAYGLAEIAETLRPDVPRLLLVIDQFEELFRYGDEASGTARAGMREEARAFVELLLTATARSAGRLQICVTMRSDYFGACSAYVGLAEAVSQSQFLIPLPTREQLDDAIHKPIALIGASIEENLVQRLLVDVEEEQDKLPLLQHTLRRLWEHASGDPRTLREQDYVDVGKISGSINKKAESIATRLKAGNPEDLVTLECVMKALTELDERNRASRHPRTRKELLALVSEQLATTPALAEASLDRMIGALQAEDTSFLVVGGSDDPGVDIGHEALIRSWARLSGPQHDFSEGWLREERDDGERWRDYVRRAGEGATLDSSELKALSTWPRNRGFAKVWSERYGNKWEIVESLKKKSTEAQLRRRTSMGAIVGLLCALGIAIIWMGYGLYRGAIDTSQRALVANRTVQSAQKLLDQLSASIEHGDITTKGADDMLTAAGEIVQKVRDFKPVEDKTTTALLVNLGYTASDIKNTIGQTDNALVSATESKEMAEKVDAASPDDPRILQLLFGGYWRIGDVISSHGKSRGKDALQEYGKAEKIADRLLKIAPNDRNNQWDLMLVKQKIGDIWQMDNKWAEAIKEYEVAQGLINKVLSDNPSSRSWRRDLANTLSRIGQAYNDKPDFDKAMQYHRDALKLRMDLLAEDSNDHVVLSNLATSHRDIAIAYADHDEVGKALTSITTAVETLEGLLKIDSNNATWQASLAALYGRKGGLHRTQREPQAALGTYRLAYGLRQDLAKKDPGNSDRQISLVRSGISIADVLEEQKSGLDEALRLYREAIPKLDEVRPRFDTDVFNSHFKIGNILAFQGGRDQPLNEYKQASAIARDADPESTTWKRRLANAYRSIGDILSAWEPSDEARQNYQLGLDIVTDLARKNPRSKDLADQVKVLREKVQGLPATDPPN